ncbi:MAG: hypothetical protein IRY91_09535 [Gemmatimonadaceae bacterium]|nr:hypothetical protein [Gemmatimonadaceae bacterium]
MMAAAMPTFIDDLVPMTREDYDGVIARYAERCSRLPGVCAIYRFGSIGAPGVSDLEVIVVLDGEVARRDPELDVLSIDHAAWKDDETLRRCFIHDVLVCDREVFRAILWLIVGSEIQRVAGEATNIITPPPSTSVYIELVQGLDFCVARLHEFARLRARPKLSKRWLIPQLWSITHTHRLLARLGIPLASSWSDLHAQLEALRQTALTVQDDVVGSLWATVERHFAMAIELLLGELVRRRACGRDAARQACIVAGEDQRMINAFRAARAGAARGDVHITASLLRRECRLGRRRVESWWTRLDAPPTLLLHHIAYWRNSQDQAQVALARRLARRVGDASSVAHEGEYGRVVAQRMRLVEANDRLLARLGITFGHVVIPGLPRSLWHSRHHAESARYRAVKAFLDWRMLPKGTIALRSAGR